MVDFTGICWFGLFYRGKAASACLCALNFYFTTQQALRLACTDIRAHLRCICFPFLWISSNYSYLTQNNCSVVSACVCPYVKIRKTVKLKLNSDNPNKEALVNYNLIQWVPSILNWMCMCVHDNRELGGCCSFSSLTNPGRLVLSVSAGTMWNS